MKVSEVFKALSDESRIRIVNLLQKGELCVCEIETILGLSQTNASRHLGKLKSAGIVEMRKEYQWVYYRICERFLKDNPSLAQSLFETCKGDEQCASDLQKLNKYRECGFNCEKIRTDKTDVVKQIK
ncbi:MAG: metalloregulator ArsR/SmtB family transcription factor [Eubacteriales bacterium]